MSKKGTVDMHKKEFSVLYAKGELTKTGQNYLTALPVIERIFDCFSKEATHVGYDGPSYSPAGYVTHSRVKKKILNIAKNEDFNALDACSLEKDYKIASQDFKASITLDVKRGYVIFAVPREVDNIKLVIDETRNLVDGPELVYFKTTKSGDMLRLAYGKSRESIRGFEELSLE